MSESSALSVVVPTFREAPNLTSLAERLFSTASKTGLSVELIVVDDNSQDGTVEVVESLTRQFPVRLVVRTQERGLSSAVLAGFAVARHQILVVMDADLQHPPESVPALVAPLLQGRADFVVGSRYVDQGSIVGRWSFFRKLNSHAARLLARPLTSLRDPMSGFFALYRSSWVNAAPLNPVGYKIALELLVKTRSRRCVEVPIEFAQRQAGESKLSFSEQLRYLRHLARLYRFRLTDRERKPSSILTSQQSRASDHSWKGKR